MAWVFDLHRVETNSTNRSVVDRLLCPISNLLGQLIVNLLQVFKQFGIIIHSLFDLRTYLCVEGSWVKTELLLLLWWRVMLFFTQRFLTLLGLLKSLIQIDLCCCKNLGLAVVHMSFLLFLGFNRFVKTVDGTGVFFLDLVIAKDPKLSRYLKLEHRLILLRFNKSDRWTVKV